jgi:hypothetical protein
MGKRAWRTPIPHLSLLDRKAGQGLMFFGKEENTEHQTSNAELRRQANPQSNSIVLVVLVIETE